MDYCKLETSIVDAIEEEQIKLGYQEETVRLYYPLDSLNQLVGASYDVLEMVECLQTFACEAEPRLGKISVSNRGERFCLAIPPAGVSYIYQNRKPNPFLEDFIGTIGRHGCTLEEVFAQFHKYSKHVCIEKAEHGEFDYLVYFEDGIPDSYRYCITVESCHIIYHRYTIEDYEGLGLS